MFHGLTAQKLSTKDIINEVKKYVVFVTPNTYYKHQHKLWQLQTQKINKINPTRYNTNTTVNHKQEEETYKQLQDPPTYNTKCKVFIYMKYNHKFQLGQYQILLEPHAISNSSFLISC
jgi:hypothetical protein